MPPRRSPALVSRNLPALSGLRPDLTPVPLTADPKLDRLHEKSSLPDPFLPDAPSPRTPRLTDLPDGRPRAALLCPERRILRDISHEPLDPFLRGAPAPEAGGGTTSSPPPVDAFSSSLPPDGSIPPFLRRTRPLTGPCSPRSASCGNLAGRSRGHEPLPPPDGEAPLP